MKALIAAVVIATALTPASADDFLRGNDVHDLCSTAPDLMTGFVVGARNQYIWSDVFLEYALPESKQSDDVRARKRAHFTLCIPEEATNGQIQEVYCRFLSDHPELRHESAIQLFHMSIRNVWPCPQQ